MNFEQQLLKFFSFSNSSGSFNAKALAISQILSSVGFPELSCSISAMYFKLKLHLSAMSVWRKFNFLRVETRLF